jgi:hypothetical protein
MGVSVCPSLSCSFLRCTVRIRSDWLLSVYQPARSRSATPATAALPLPHCQPSHSARLGHPPLLCYSIAQLLTAVRPSSSCHVRFAPGPPWKRNESWVLVRPREVCTVHSAACLYEKMVRVFCIVPETDGWSCPRNGLLVTGGFWAEEKTQKPTEQVLQRKLQASSPRLAVSGFFRSSTINVIARGVGSGGGGGACRSNGAAPSGSHL